MKRLAGALGPLLLGLAFLLLIAWPQHVRVLKGQNDFVADYIGARLAGTPQLYDHAANMREMYAALHLYVDKCPYVRAPFYAVFLKPLSWLPYDAAHAVFAGAMLASVIAFVLMFRRECPPLAFFTAMSVPLLESFCIAQDSPLLLPIVGVSVLLSRRGRQFAAGAVLALCAIKFHLFLFVPLLVLVKKKWRMAAGGVAGLAALAVLGAAVNGIDAVSRWLKVMRDPWINPASRIMPNLHGLVAAAQGGVVMEAVLVIAVVAAFLWLAFRTDNYELLLGVALVSSQLTSYHSTITDDVLLLAAFVLIYGSSNAPVPRILFALALTPVPAFLVVVGAPWNAVLPLMLMATIAAVCVAVEFERNPGMAEALMIRRAPAHP